jgi:hypothetical protein
MSVKSDYPTIFPPALQSALLCLDLSLDQELDRYRHWRKTGKTYSYTDLSAQLKTDQKPLLSLPTPPNQNPYIALDLAEKAEKEIEKTLQRSSALPLVQNIQNPINQYFTPSSTPNSAQPLEQIVDKAVEQSLDVPSLELAINQNRSNLNQVPSDQISNSDQNPIQTSNQSVNQSQDQNIDQTRELLQNLTNPPASPKNEGFKFTSPLGIVILLILCAVSGLLGYLLIDRLLMNKVLPNPVPSNPATSSPQSNLFQPVPSSSSSDRQEPLQDIAKTSLPPIIQSPQFSPSSIPSASNPSSAFLPNLNSNFSSISTLLKPPVRLNQPAVSVRRFPVSTTQSWRDLPTPLPEYSSPAPVLPPQAKLLDKPLENSLANSRPTRESYRGIDSVQKLGNPPPIMSTNPLRPSSSKSSLPPLSPELPASPLTRNSVESYSKNPTESISKVVPNPIAPPLRSFNIQPANPIENAPVKYAPLVTAKVESKSEPKYETKDDKRYAIVAPNRYMTEGKQVEKEAFIRPSDGQIQLGSFRDAESAQRRIEELRKQGIPVDAIRVEAK